MTQAIPEGFHSLSCHLIVSDARKAIEFYTKAFGAKPGGILVEPKTQKVVHAEVKIGDCTLMLCEEMLDFGRKTPQTLGGTPVGLHLYVDNADAVFEQAVQAGATVAMPIAEMFWGDRYGRLVDPFGHQWSVATHVRDVSMEECEKAMAEGACG